MGEDECEPGGKGIVTERRRVDLGFKGDGDKPDEGVWVGVSDRERGGHCEPEGELVA